MIEPIQVWDGDGISPVDRQLIEKLRGPAHMGDDLVDGLMFPAGYQMPVIKSALPRMSINDIVNVQPMRGPMGAP